MTIKADETPFVIFDLDDTLFPEIEFLKSAFREISIWVLEKTGSDVYEDMLKAYFNKKNAFEWIIEKYKDQIPGCNRSFLLSLYRNHLPKIKLVEETSVFLQQLRKKKIPMGLITDGRSTSQRNKLKALGIENYFSEIIISEEFGSEKPDARNFIFLKKNIPTINFILLATIHPKILLYQHN